MRPLRLEMEGFATFRRSTVVEFDGLDLVALTGPTGAGKSSIIDAITFALYGSVARYDNTNLIAPVINQQATEARVRLDFEIGGHAYVVVRVARRTRGGASTREARLERYDAPWSGEQSDPTSSLAGSVGELDAAIADLVGLDFGQFTRTIVLPQGEFAQFLRDEPKNRQALLRRLLDIGVYARIGSMARESASATTPRLEALRSERDHHRAQAEGEADLGTLTNHLDAISALRADAGRQLAELADIEQRLVPLRERVGTIDALTTRLDAIEAPADLDQVVVERATADQTQAEARAALDQARAERDQAQSTVEELGDRFELTAALAALAGQSELEDELVALDQRLADLTADEERLGAEGQAAAGELDEAEAIVDRANQQAGAAQWTATLIEGEPCPVCHQSVTSVPDHDAESELLAAQDRQAKARTAHRAADTRLREAKAARRQADDSRQRAQAGLEEVVATLADRFSGLATDPAELEARIGRIRLAEEARDLSLRAVAESERALSQAETSSGRLAERVHSLGTALASARDSVSALDPPPLGVSGPDSVNGALGEGWATLLGWAADQGGELAAERAGLADEGKRLAQAKKEIDSALRARAESLGLVAEPADLEVVAAQAETETRAAIAAQAERQATLDRLESQIDEAAESAQVDQALALQLRSDRFEAWLLDEAMQTITERATGWLYELSRGAYSLASADREFVIIDHTNADEQRSVRTLSGGETFLASLSLALALADSVGELASVDTARLGSMFLDEGFGTLDPETLDVVASAIEELASTGRMIGIVTHVSDLAERMPSRFEVTKGPEGSLVNLVSGG